MLQRSKLGFLTQGTIFCCAKAEDYGDCEVFGLVITARCDVANDKAPIYNYLPVVSLRDWLDRDGGSLLANRIANGAMASIQGEIKRAGHSAEILKTEPLPRVVDVLFPHGSAKKSDVQLRERLLKAVAQWTLAIKCLEAPMAKGRGNVVVQENASLVRGLVGELTTHRLSGYHFLPQVEFDGAAQGYVVHLREVGHLPRPIAMSVASGVDFSLEENAEVRRAIAYLNPGCGPYAMPVGQLSSPTIEHVLQQFSLTFSRIGVADLSQDYLSEVLGKLLVGGGE